jgi:IrrE N-terminal-like domain
VAKLFPRDEQMVRAHAKTVEGHAQDEVRASGRCEDLEKESVCGQGERPELSEVIRTLCCEKGFGESPHTLLIGSRRRAGSFCRGSGIIDESVPFSVLRDCPPWRALHNRFACSGVSSTVECWVNWAMGEEDRSLCFGRTATSRATRLLDVKYVPKVELPCDGQFGIASGYRIILTSSRQSPQREIFTFAHELGHAALYLFDPNTSYNSKGIERICNLFAVELIIPTKFVSNVWRSARDAEAIIEIANKTDCSLSTSCIRLTEYLSNASAGVASRDGVIQECYGLKLSRDSKDLVETVSRGAMRGEMSWSLPCGAVLSVRYVPQRKLVVFVMQRIA